MIWPNSAANAVQFRRAPTLAASSRDEAEVVGVAGRHAEAPPQLPQELTHASRRAVVPHAPPPSDSRPGVSRSAALGDCRRLEADGALTHCAHRWSGDNRELSSVKCHANRKRLCEIGKTVFSWTRTRFPLHIRSTRESRSMKRRSSQ